MPYFPLHNYGIAVYIRYANRRHQDYSRKVRKILTKAERDAAEAQIAADPTNWPVIAGTGGVRKARTVRGSSGKRGGARVIYYYWSSHDTVFLLTAYAKSAQTDLTAADKKALRDIVKSLEGT